VKERPILFKPEMVQAIIAKEKTVTRRKVKDPDKPCPYGQVGDRLWVKETWSENRNWTGWAYAYKLEKCTWYDEDMKGLWNSPMFMPRKASRIILEITNVRVERLNDISASSAEREGVALTKFWTPKELEWKPFEEKWWDDFTFWSNYPQIVFKRLWESINGEGSWQENPLVWVIEFKVVQS